MAQPESALETGFSVVSLVAPLLVFLIAGWLLSNKYKVGLTSIPGPPVAAWTSLWRVYDVSRGQAHQTAIQLHRKYGKLVRIAPEVISVGDPAMIPVIYNTKGNFKKSAFYSLQEILWKGKFVPNLFSTRDEGWHRDYKRKIAQQYSLDSLLKMENAVDDCSKLLIEKMDSYVDGDKTVDLGTWLQYYAFDVVGCLTYDQDFGFLKKGGDVDGMMGSIEAILGYSAVVGQVPAAHSYLLGNPIIPKLMPQIEDWNMVVKFTLKYFKERTRMNDKAELEIQPGLEGNDMLSQWAAVKAADPLKMDTLDIVVGTSSNVFAGSDTTAASLRSILYQLLRNSAKMECLRQELDKAAKTGELSDPVTDKEARALPYLNAVIKEGMRMHPSIGLLLEREVPEGGAVICGRHIRAGTIVGINPWVMHYDTEVFPQPESFQPERWLSTDDSTVEQERLARMERSFFAFGAGSRTCIGKNIGLLEMRKLVPQLLRTFEVSLAPEADWRISNVWFVQQSGLKCNLKRRI